MKTLIFYRYFIFLLLIGALVLVSCKPLTPEANLPPTETLPSPTQAHPTPTQGPSSTPNGSQMAAVQAAVQVLAKELNLEPSQISVVSFQIQNWPDACLGLPEADEICAEMIVPGVEGVLLANGAQYGFRADENGKEIRFIPSAVFSAMNVLAQKAGVTPEEIAIVKTEKVEWPDACLGVTISGQMCAQVVTPGYRVVLELSGVQYEYHTDESGGNVIPADVPDGGANQALVTWTQTVDGKCVSASIGMEEVFYGPCDGQKAGAPLMESRKAELTRFVQKFASFEADTVVGKLTFVGQGQITATPVQQRAIAEWALLVDQEAEPGRDSAAQGLAFAWHREGGIAGFCDDVSVYLTGFAYVTSCKGNQAKDLGNYLLTSQQLHQLYSLLADYQRFDSQQKDTASADSMTIRMVFGGTGAREADPTVKDSLNSLASQTVNQANTPQNPEELSAALQVLQDYYAALNANDYAKAVELYGGSYELLTNNNPDVPPTDTGGLFQKACSQNGFRCDLKVIAVADRAQLSSEDFRFSLQFQNPNGEVFSLGPCCGASEQDMPPQTQFDFLVKKVDGKYMVMSLPVYMP